MDSSYYTTYASPVKRKVLGDINNTADSPISPTANLKLLTKVASQFDSIENANFTNLLKVKPEVGSPLNSKLFKSRENPYNAENTKTKGHRKFKSLGFLCDKFLKLYPLNVSEHSQSIILLTDIANQLEVEKRRVYDIINVVESLQMATKVGKNSYEWSGHRKLADTLSQLKAYAEQIGLVQYVRMQQFNRKLFTKLHEGELDSGENSAFQENSNIASFFRNERRIGILCQKFIMLFLVSLQDGVINLELASQVLMGNECHGQQSKTRLRRLYDIANILVSLGIITKQDLGGTIKKSAFRYAGPPLHILDEIKSEGTLLLTDLVKTELSENNGSDYSESSAELWWEEEQLQRCVDPENDHSYSLSVSEKPLAVVAPAAKKRLVFATDSVRAMWLANGGQLKCPPARVMRVQPHTAPTVKCPPTRVVDVQPQTAPTVKCPPTGVVGVQPQTAPTVKCPPTRVVGVQPQTAPTVKCPPTRVVGVQPQTAPTVKCEHQVKPLIQIQSSLPVSCPQKILPQTSVLQKSEKTTTAFLRVLSQSAVPQTIKNGGVYKAIRVGNDIQLIRIDDS